MKTVKIEVPDNLHLLIGVVSIVKNDAKLIYERNALNKVEELLIKISNSKEISEEA